MPKTTHGKWKSKEWNSWNHIKGRCLNPNHAKYKDYGAKGIEVCERWLLFENFYADMGDAPSKDHTIDRYPNNNGNYEPNNCRWASPKEQANNTRANLVLEYKGEKMSISEWAKKLNCYPSTLQYRFNQGWPVDKIITKPFTKSPSFNKK